MSQKQKKKKKKKKKKKNSILTAKEGNERLTLIPVCDIHLFLFGLPSAPQVGSTTKH